MATCDFAYHNRDSRYGETEEISATDQETDNLSWENWAT